ncbi:MAG TPA: hypothetical protein PKH64_11815 [Petrotogaceae bacterium]|jgi:hypothetical protein|nr:hypothetical protein [Petrotogaceae bacterium]HNV06800.1 hypothetical protein [Petrotogaceae bacterium]HPG48905.1 hypothetical protein [Petrotogaceae bacterium]HQO12855.1 hypothetical protein [Petrotogaceae bacterium]HQP58495.1 hypothetical protein [Petrotogaceae bacterium]
MQQLTGLIPYLVSMIEMPGNGSKKKETVLQAAREICKQAGIYSPFIEIALSVLIDGVVAIINPK